MRNSITALGLVILLTMLTSCHAYIDVSGQKNFQTFQDKNNVHVLYLRTNEDSTIVFSEKMPGKLVNNQVVGTHQMLLQDFAPDSIIYMGNQKDPKFLYAVKYGVRYDIIDRDSNKLVYNTSEIIRVPFTEIKEMYVRKPTVNGTALFLAGVSGGTVGLLSIAMSALF